MTKGRYISAKKRLEILKRDNYTCVMCGKSPSKYPELTVDVYAKLEIDHVVPFSKNGSCDIDNLQTLCMECNRGKGKNEELNKTSHDKIQSLLLRINPQILADISKNGFADVVANQEDFQELQRLVSMSTEFAVQASPAVIIGFRARYNCGATYTIQDNYGQKIRFIITKNG